MQAEVNLWEAQRGLDGSEGAWMCYLIAWGELADAEREAVGLVILGDLYPNPVDNLGAGNW